MTLAPGMLPNDEDCVRLERLGFDPVEDTRSTEYVRFPYGKGRTGLLYASHLPIPWGVYWRGVAQCKCCCWCRDLETALELLILVQ